MVCVELVFMVLKGSAELLLGGIVLTALGIVLYIIVAAYYPWLLKKDESGALHLLLACIFAVWLPVPLIIYQILGAPSSLLIGTIFGVAGLFLFLITMLLQAGHLTYSTKQEAISPSQLWEERDNWMLGGMLRNTFEIFAGLLEAVWIIFLTMSFLQSGS